MRRAIVVLICLAGFASVAFAVDVLGVQRTPWGWPYIVWEWHADGSGAATGLTDEIVNGMAYRAWYEPAASNSTAETYAVTGNEAWEITRDLLTYGSSDIFSGACASDNTTTLTAETLWPTHTIPVGSRIRLNVSSATANSYGRFVLVFAPWPANGD